MIVVNSIAAASAAAGAIWLIASSVLVAVRLRRKALPQAAPDAPVVALIRPLAGMEHRIEAALRTSFELSYPRVEILFCVEDEADPAVAVARRLIAEYPHANARILLGHERIGINPKINNIAKAWHATEAEWLVVADSNAVLQVDYVEGVMARWAPGRGIVSTPTLMIEPDSLAADVEAAFVNLSQTRASLAADMLGFGYVVGKTMLWRRDTLEKAGGLAAIASEFGDDVIARHRVLAAGMTARIGRPIPQRAGERTAREVWDRQVRWLRVGRNQANAFFYLGLLQANILPMFWIAVLATTGVLPWVALPVFIAAWYAIEAALAKTVGWPFSWRTPLALVLRDLLFIPMWLAALRSRRVEWRGHVEPGPGSRGDRAGAARPASIGAPAAFAASDRLRGNREGHPAAVRQPHDGSRT